MCTQSQYLQRVSIPHTQPEMGNLFPRFGFRIPKSIDNVVAFGAHRIVVHRTQQKYKFQVRVEFQLIEPQKSIIFRS